MDLSFTQSFEVRIPYDSSSRQLDLGHSLHHILRNSILLLIQFYTMTHIYRSSISIQKNNCFSMPEFFRLNIPSLSARILLHNNKLLSEFGILAQKPNILQFYLNNKRRKKRKRKEQDLVQFRKYYKRFHNGVRLVKKIRKLIQKKELKLLEYLKKHQMTIMLILNWDHNTTFLSKII